MILATMIMPIFATVTLVIYKEYQGNYGYPLNILIPKCNINKFYDKKLEYYHIIKKKKK